jgi:Kazal-type serine protease inhibitor domain
MMRKLCLVWPLIAASAFVFAFVDSGGAAAAGLGQFCGGRLGIGCERGLFCEFPASTCGNANAEGKCVRSPRFCAQKLALRPVCGCDGKSYRNDCHRRRAAVAKLHDARC